MNERQIMTLGKVVTDKSQLNVNAALASGGSSSSSSSSSSGINQNPFSSGGREGGRESRWGTSRPNTGLAAGVRYNLLNVQYRMHETICEFPSGKFYGGEIKSDYLGKNSTE